MVWIRLRDAARVPLPRCSIARGFSIQEEMALEKGDSVAAEEARTIYERFKKRPNTIAWDGKWYTRGFSRNR